MNRLVLVCAGVALLVFGGLALMKGSQKTLPYYVRQHAAHASPLTSPQSIFLEPPTVDQIKQDLSGKTITIAGQNHQFAGPELNYMNILTTNPAANDGLEVDVQICADATIVNKKGILGVRKTYTHENVCGSLRVYYERKDGKWTYRMAENIDLQKMLHPNTKAPPSGTQVFRYPSR